MPKSIAKPAATSLTHTTISYLSAEQSAALPPDMQWARLPFIDGQAFLKGKPKLTTPYPYWTLPAVGDYCGNCDVGRLMARALLKHLAETDDPLSFLLLGDILTDLTARLAESIARHQCQDLSYLHWPTKPNALRAQRIGFTSELGSWLAVSARRLSMALAGLSEDALIQSANTALSLTDEEVVANALGRTHGRLQ